MKIVDFVKEMKTKAAQGLLEVSGTGECIEKTYAFKVGQAHILTVRGGAIEKAAITHLDLKGVRPPGVTMPVNATVFQMEVFPDNPYCPMGHFNTEWTMNGSCLYHMNLDLFPAVQVTEDLERMKNIMDGVADKFGRDRNKMREGLDSHYNMDHWNSPLATKVGCKLLKLQEGDLGLFITAYHSFFDGYLEILRKRKNTQVSQKDLKLKLERNSKWLEYISLKDQAFKMAQTTGIPSEVLIALSYPPSAGF